MGPMGSMVPLFSFVVVFGMGGMEECLNVDKNKPMDKDSEKNNSRVDSLERQEGIGSGAKVDRLPKEKKRETHSILAGLKVKGMGGNEAGLVLLMAES